MCAREGPRCVSAASGLVAAEPMSVSVAFERETDANATAPVAPIRAMDLHGSVRGVTTPV